MDEPIQLPIDGVLDLHTFQPREVKDLVPDYLAACKGRGILQVRIIHGKGPGNFAKRSTRSSQDIHRLLFHARPSAVRRLGRNNRASKKRIGAQAFSLQKSASS